MNLAVIDWIFIGGFFALSMLIGVYFSKRASKSTEEFFLSGRNMPWWLLGISMVATTFSADTPNLVTDIIRTGGVAGNWQWWAFLLTGMLTVFVYARLWRRSGILTDLEFYELRYSGKAAAFLRGFRAIYLGVIFNVMIMASVTLAAIKIAGVMLGFTPLQTVLIGGVVTVIYTSLGGLRGVIATDFFQFGLAMIGMVGAAIILVRMPEVGGLEALLSHEAVSGKTAMIPSFDDPSVWVPLFLIPLAVQWWSTWYPGAEPGGGGYIAQRMLASKDEKNAVGATLLFNVAHYSLRPWPWIIIALCSLVVFPDIASIQAAFPEMDPKFVKDDLAFPAMLTFLPKGLFGLVMAALIAAFMSTISTHLNWGASYVVHDFYGRFVNQGSTERERVLLARITTVVLMFLASIVALALSNALEAFQILLQIGAGTGLIFILRWFWWRINAYSEIAAMIVSFAIAVYFKRFYNGDLEPHWQMLVGVVVTTIVWMVATLTTRPTDAEVLKSFVARIRPYKMGWARVIQRMPEGTYSDDSSVTRDLSSMLYGSIMIYCILFSTGYFIYGDVGRGAIAGAVALVSAWLLRRNWRRIQFY